VNTTLGMLKLKRIMIMFCTHGVLWHIGKAAFILKLWRARILQLMTTPWRVDSTIHIAKPYQALYVTKYVNKSFCVFLYVEYKQLDKKVKNEVVPLHAMKAHRGSRGTPPLILNLGIRLWWVRNENQQDVLIFLNLFQ